MTFSLTDELGIPNDAFGDQFRMLHDVAGMRNDTGAEHFAVRHLYLLKQVIFVLVARIRALETIALLR